jgi:hypothetical protein
MSHAIELNEVAGDQAWIAFARTLETELTAVRGELEKAKSVRNDRERRRVKAEAEMRDMQALFDIQHTRMKEAVDVWRNENPGNELVLPDLGKLLEWMLGEMRSGQYSTQYLKWKMRANELDAENDGLKKERDEARADLKLNAGMLARQCDMARQAENERDALRKAVGDAVEWLKAVGSIGMLPCDMECVAKAMSVLTPTPPQEPHKPDCETCGRAAKECTHQEVPKAGYCEMYKPACVLVVCEWTKLREHAYKSACGGMWDSVRYICPLCRFPVKVKGV